jgi:uncharacterized repeat protein (TIGR03803 family)
MVTRSILCLAVFGATLPMACWGAPTYAVVHEFGTGSDGATPQSGVRLGSDGTLYGTTLYGGAAFDGTIVSIQPLPGKAQVTEMVQHSFTGDQYGYFPAPFSIAAGNVIYGIDSPKNGIPGLLFSLTPSAQGGPPVIAFVHSFQGIDGQLPNEPTLGPDGSLYGTTFQGGAPADGLAYRLSPPAMGQTSWTETILYTFAGQPDGAAPNSRLTFGPNGVLYGTTSRGGADNVGAVFQLTPPAAGQTQWTERLLHSFAAVGGPDGSAPSGGVTMDAAGALYGTTASGGAHFGGVAYRLTPPGGGGTAWRETILHGFGHGSDGTQPMSGLAVASTGALYGTTTMGGAHNRGAVFELLPPAGGTGHWTYANLHRFGGGLDGANPVGLLALDASGVVYGTTSGGANPGGTVFQITP